MRSWHGKLMCVILCHDEVCCDGYGYGYFVFREGASSVAAFLRGQRAFCWVQKEHKLSGYAFFPGKSLPFGY